MRPSLTRARAPHPRVEALHHDDSPAQLFLAWVAFPEIQVQLSKYISFGPINLKALPLLGGPEFDHVREYLPTSPANIPYAIIHDEQDTAVRFNDIYPRYLEFLQGE